jgi:hypothetical protein
MKTGNTDRRATARTVRVAVYGESYEVASTRRLNERRQGDQLQAITGQPDPTGRAGRRAADRLVVAPTRSIRSW